MTQVERRHMWIEGRVQGVGFRVFVRSRAAALGVNGFVRNLPDGRVEVVAEGSPDALDKLEKWIRRGPRRARVDRVRLETECPSGSFKRFSVEQA